MSHPLLAALLVLASASAAAQTTSPRAGATDRRSPAPATSATPAPQAQQPEAADDDDAAAPQQPAPAAPAGASVLTPEQQEAVRREVDRLVEQAKQEIRAERAAASATEEWTEDFAAEERKLELFTVDGYLRVRPTLFNKFDLNASIPADQRPFPGSPRLGSGSDRTQAFATLRARVEPTFNVSEEVRVKVQMDLFDNLVMGSTPEGASGLTGAPFDVFGESQATERSGVDALRDSLNLRRAYGEVSTPVGLLRFGRMGSNWGLGMLRNDGNCFDCDHGDTVDRIQFVTEPFAGWYVTPMLDFNVEGPTRRPAGSGEPFDISNNDDAHSLVLAIARRDTEQQVKAKLDSDQGVLNYGLHFTYRTQNLDALRYDRAVSEDPQESDLQDVWVPRRARLFVPDLWLRYEQKRFRVELELAAILGKIGSSESDRGDVAGLATTDLGVRQFGAVAQAEFKPNNSVKLQGELGYASGDPARGFGTRPLSPSDGDQYVCTETGCSDRHLENFTFNRDYRVDLILFREILGGVSDAVYFKPSLTYTVAPGFDLYGAAIYSQSVKALSTPSQDSHALGLELNAGVSYQTEDGFVSGLQYGMLFPFAGLRPIQQASSLDLSNPQTLRATLGIKF